MCYDKELEKVNLSVLLVRKQLYRTQDTIQNDVYKKALQKLLSTVDDIYDKLNKKECL